MTDLWADLLRAAFWESISKSCDLGFDYFYLRYRSSALSEWKRYGFFADF